MPDGIRTGSAGAAAVARAVRRLGPTTRVPLIIYIIIIIIIYYYYYYYYYYFINWGWAGNPLAPSPIPLVNRQAAAPPPPSSHHSAENAGWVGGWVGGSYPRYILILYIIIII